MKKILSVLSLFCIVSTVKPICIKEVINRSDETVEIYASQFVLDRFRPHEGPVSTTHHGLICQVPDSPTHRWDDYVFVGDYDRQTGVLVESGGKSHQIELLEIRKDGSVWADGKNLGIPAKHSLEAFGF
jgi:hypothetical protein